MANGLLNWYKEKLTREGTDVSKYSDEQLVYSLGKRMEGEYGPQKIKEYPEFSQQYTSVVNAKQAKRLGRDGFFGGIKEIGAGFGQGLDETQGMLYGGGGYLAKKVGLDSASKWLMKQSLDNMRESQKNAPTIQSFSEVSSFGEGLRFLSGGLGRVIPSGATMIGTGGVGGLAGKQILKKAVVGPALRKEAERAAKRGYDFDDLMKSSTKRYADLSPTMQEVAKNYAQGLSLIGTTTAASGTMGIGEVYSSLYPYTQLDPQDKDYVTPEDAEALSWKFGIAIGALDSILPSMVGGPVLKKFFPGKKPTAVDAARADAFVKRNLLGAVAKGVAVEGSTEATQEYLNVVAEKFAHKEDSPFDITEFSDEEINQLIDGGILGTIGGSVFSGSTELYAGKKAQLDAINAKKKKQEDFDKSLSDIIASEFKKKEATQKAVDSLTPEVTFEIGQKVVLPDGDTGEFVGRRGDDALVKVQPNAELERFKTKPVPIRALQPVEETTEETTEETVEEENTVDEFRKEKEQEVEEQKQENNKQPTKEDLKKQKLAEKELHRNTRVNGIPAPDAFAYDFLSSFLDNEDLKSNNITKRALKSLDDKTFEDAYNSWIDLFYTIGVDQPSKDQFVEAFKRGAEQTLGENFKTKGDIVAEQRARDASKAVEQEKKKAEEDKARKEEQKAKDREEKARQKKLDRIQSIANNPSNRFIVSAEGASDITRVDNAILTAARAKKDNREFKISPISEEEYNDFLNDETKRASLTIQSAGGKGRLSLPKSYDEYVDDIDNLNTVITENIRTEEQVNRIIDDNTPKQSDDKPEEIKVTDGSELTEVPGVVNGQYIFESASSKNIFIVSDEGVGNSKKLLNTNRPNTISEILLRVKGRKKYEIYKVTTPNNEEIQLSFDGVYVNYKIKDGIESQSVAGLSEKNAEYKYGPDDENSTSLENPDTQDHVKIVKSQVFDLKPKPREVLLKEKRKEKPRPDELPDGNTKGKSRSNNAVVIRHKESGKLFARTINGENIHNIAIKGDDEAFVSLDDSAVGMNIQDLPDEFEIYGAILFSGHPATYRQDFNTEQEYNDWLSSFKDVEFLEEGNQIETRLQKKLKAKKESGEPILLSDFLSPSAKFDKYFNIFKGEIGSLEIEEILNKLDETTEGKSTLARIYAQSQNFKNDEDIPNDKESNKYFIKEIKGVGGKNASNFTKALTVALKLNYEYSSSENLTSSQKFKSVKSDSDGKKVDIFEAIPGSGNPRADLENKEVDKKLSELLKVNSAKQFADWVADEQIQILHKYSKDNLQGLTTDEAIRKVKFSKNYKEVAEFKTANRIIFEIRNSISERFPNDQEVSIRFFYDYLVWLGGQSLPSEQENSNNSSSSTTETANNLWQAIVSHYENMGISIKDNAQSIISKHIEGDFSPETATEISTNAFRLFAFRTDIDTTRGELVMGISDVTGNFDLYGKIGDAIENIDVKKSTRKNIESAIEDVFIDNDINNPSAFINILNDVLLDAMKQLGINVRPNSNPYPILNGKQLFEPRRQTTKDAIEAGNPSVSSPTGEPILEMADPYLGSTPHYSSADNSDAYNIAQSFKRGTNHEQNVIIPEGQEFLNNRAIEELIGDNMFVPIVLERIKRYVENTGKSQEAKEFMSRYMDVLEQALSNSNESLGIQVVDEISSAPGRITRGTYVNNQVLISRKFYLGEYDLKYQDLPMELTDDETTNVLMSVIMHESWHGTMEAPIRAYEKGTAPKEIVETIDLIKDVIDDIKQQPGAKEFAFLYSNDSRAVSELLNYAWTRKDFAEFLSNTRFTNESLLNRIDQNGRGFISTLMDALIAAYSKLLGVMGINVEGTALKSVLELSKQLEAQNQALQPQIAEMDNAMSAMADNPAPIFYSQMEKVLNVIQGDTRQSQEEIQLRQELNQIKKELPEYFNGDKRDDTEGKVALLKRKGAIENQLKGFGKPKPLPNEATGKRWKKILVDEGVSANELKVTIGSLLDEIGDRKINLTTLRRIANAANQVPIVSNSVVFQENDAEYSGSHDFDRFATTEKIKMLFGHGMAIESEFLSEEEIRKRLQYENERRLENIFSKPQSFGINFSIPTVKLWGKTLKPDSDLGMAYINTIMPYEIPTPGKRRQLAELYTRAQMGEVELTHEIIEPTALDTKEFREKFNQALSAIGNLNKLSDRVRLTKSRIEEFYGSSSDVTRAIEKISKESDNITDEEILNAVRVIYPDGIPNLSGFTGKFETGEKVRIVDEGAYGDGYMGQVGEIWNVDGQRGVLNIIFAKGKSYETIKEFEFWQTEPVGKTSIPNSIEELKTAIENVIPSDEWDNKIPINSIVRLSENVTLLDGRTLEAEGENKFIGRVVSSDRGTIKVKYDTRDASSGGTETVTLDPGQLEVVRRDDVDQVINVLKIIASLEKASPADIQKIFLNSPREVRLKNEEKFGGYSYGFANLVFPSDRARLVELAVDNFMVNANRTNPNGTAGLTSGQKKALQLPEEIELELKELDEFSIKSEKFFKVKPDFLPSRSLRHIITRMDRMGPSNIDKTWNTLSDSWSSNSANRRIDMLHVDIRENKGGLNFDWLTSLYLGYDGNGRVDIRGSEALDIEFEGRRRWQGVIIDSDSTRNKPSNSEPILKFKGDTSIDYLELGTHDPSNLTKLLTPMEESIGEKVDDRRSDPVNILMLAPGLRDISLSDVTEKTDPLPIMQGSSDYDTIGNGEFEILGDRLPEEQVNSLEQQGYRVIKSYLIRDKYHIFLVQSTDPSSTSFGQRAPLKGKYQLGLQKVGEFAGNISSQTQKVESQLSGLEGMRVAVEMANIVKSLSAKYGDLYVGTHSQEKFRKYESLLNKFKFKTEVGTAQGYGFPEDGRLIKIFQPNSAEVRDIQFATDQEIEALKGERNRDAVKRSEGIPSHFHKEEIFFDSVDQVDGEPIAGSVVPSGESHPVNSWIRGFERIFNGEKSFIISELQSDSKQRMQGDIVPRLVGGTYSFTEGYKEDNAWNSDKKYEVGDIVFVDTGLGLTHYIAWELTKPLTNKDLTIGSENSINEGIDPFTEYKSPNSYLEEGKIIPNKGPWRLLPFRSSGVQRGSFQNPGKINFGLEGTNLYFVQINDKEVAAHFYPGQIRKIKEEGHFVKGQTIKVLTIADLIKRADVVYNTLGARLNAIEAKETEIKELQDIISAMGLPDKKAAKIEQRRKLEEEARLALDIAKRDFNISGLSEELVDDNQSFPMTPREIIGELRRQQILYLEKSPTAKEEFIERLSPKASRTIDQKYWVKDNGGLTVFGQTSSYREAIIDQIEALNESTSNLVSDDILLDAYQLANMKALIRYLALNKINKVVFSRGDVIYPVVSGAPRSVEKAYGEGKQGTKTQGIINAYSQLPTILGKYLGIKPKLEEGAKSKYDDVKEQFMTITIPDERLAQNLQNGERLLMEDEVNNIRSQTKSNLKITKEGDEYTIENLFREPFKTSDENDLKHIVRFKNIPSRVGILVRGDNQQPIVREGYNLVNIENSERWVKSDQIEAYDRNDLLPSNMSDQMTFDFNKKADEEVTEVEEQEAKPEIVKVKNIGNRYLTRLAARDMVWGGYDRQMDRQLAGWIADNTDIPYQTALREIDSLHAIYNATPDENKIEFINLAIDKGIKKYFGRGGMMMEDVYAEEENPNVNQPLNREANEIALAKMQIASAVEELAATSEALGEIRKIKGDPTYSVEDVYREFLNKGKSPIKFIDGKLKLYKGLEDTTIESLKDNDGMAQHTRTLALKNIERRNKETREAISNNLDQLDENFKNSLASEIKALENQIKTDPSVIFNRATQGDRINEQIAYYTQETLQEIADGPKEIDTASSATLQAYKEITGESLSPESFTDSLEKIRRYNSDFLSDLIYSVSKVNDIQGLSYNDIFNIINNDKISRNEYIIIASAIHNNKKSIFEAKLSNSDDIQGKRSTLAKLESLGKSNINQLKVIKGKNPSESLLTGTDLEKGILNSFIDKRISYLEKVAESEDLLKRNQIYLALNKYYNVNSERLQTYLGHTPVTHIVDGTKFPVMSKVGDKYEIDFITVKFSNKMMPENLEEFIISRQKNREFLSDPDNAGIQGTAEFEYIREATLAADALTVQPQHKEANGKLNLWFLKSAQEKFSEGGRVGREISQINLQFDIAYRASIARVRALGKQWDARLIKAAKAWGYKNYRSFLDDIYDKVLKWNEDQPQLNDKKSFDEGTFNKALSLVNNKEDLNLTEARDSLRNLLEQSRINTNFFLSIAEKYGVKVVQDQGLDAVLVKDRSGDEMIGLRRNPIKRGYQTHGRKIRSEYVLGIVEQLSRGLGDVESWSDTEETYFDKTKTDQEKEDAINAYLEMGIDEEILDKFIRPYIFDTSVANLISAPITSDGKIPKRYLRDAWINSKGTGSQKFLSWIDTLYESVNHSKKRTDYLKFKFNVAKAFYGRFQNLEEAVSDKGKHLDNKAYALAHRLMDSRGMQRIIPVEFLQYETYSEVDMPIQLAQILGNAIYGRNAERLTTLTKQLKDELNDKRARLVRIADLIGEKAPNTGPYTVRKNLRRKAAQIAEEMDDIPGETGAEKLKNLEASARQLENIDRADKNLKAHLEGDLGPYRDHKVMLELLGTNAFLILNQPKSGLTNLLSLGDQMIVYKGWNKFSRKALASSLSNVFGNLFGPMIENFGLHLNMTSEYAEQLNDTYFHNAEYEVDFDEYRLNLGAGVSKQSSLIDIFKYDVLRKLKDTLKYTPVKKGQRYGALSKRTLFLNPFTYLGNLANHSLAVGVVNAVDMLVKQTADFIEQTEKRTGQPLPKTFQVSPEQIGFGNKSNVDEVLSGKESLYNYINNAIELRGLGTISDLAHQYIERKKKGKTLALTKDQAIAVSTIALHDVAMEGGFASRSAFWYTQEWAKYVAPLMSWSFSKVNQINKSFRDEQTNEVTLKASLRALSVMGLWLAPIGMAFTFAMDEYDEEILGKPSSLRPAPLSTMIPIFGPFIEGDAKTNALAMVERLSRAGNIGGIAGDFIANIVSQVDPYQSQRGFSLDTRVLAMANILNISDAIKNAYNSRSLDYNLVVRPLLYSMGGNGFLQTHQAMTNLLGIDTMERRVSDMIGNRNKVRAALSTLEIERRPAVSGGFRATPFSVQIRKMEQAAYANDDKLFTEAYSDAIAAAIERGDEDPEKSVLQAYKRRTLKSGLSRYTLSDDEWNKVLSVFTPEQAKSLRRAEFMHKKYENILLDSIELNTNQLPLPVVDQKSTRPISYEDIIKQSLAF